MLLPYSFYFVLFFSVLLITSVLLLLLTCLVSVHRKWVCNISPDHSVLATVYFCFCISGNPLNFGNCFPDLEGRFLNVASLFGSSRDPTKSTKAASGRGKGRARVGGLSLSLTVGVIPVHYPLSCMPSSTHLFKILLLRGISKENGTILISFYATTMLYFMNQKSQGHPFPGLRKRSSFFSLTPRAFF